MKMCLAFLFPLVIFSTGIAQIPLDVLMADVSLRDQVLWRGDTLMIFASSEQRKFGQPEFVLFPQERSYWAQLVAELPLDSLVKRYKTKGRLPSPGKIADQPRPGAGFVDLDFPLRGWRIAIDPGHMAGAPAFAKEVEGKYVQMKACPETYGQPLSFYESELTLATARILRDSLQRLGATVLLTRPRMGEGAHGLSFEQWKATAFPDSLRQAVKSGRMNPSQAIWWTDRASDAMIFQSYYNRSDLRARVEMIRHFQPDLTLVIHYNVDLMNPEQKQDDGTFKPGLQNYSMAFVPGAFLPGELSRVEDRVMLLRLLISDDYRRSVQLCDAFIRYTELETGVPPVAANSALPYLAKFSRYAGRPGVFARNLSLTRQISGPICYGESLCQDARWEALRLNQRDLQVGDLRVSSRVAEVAAAYLWAVREFVGTQP
ncbi:MAG: hypothetical protein NWR72_14690 [Bacteroidia bacterium]|nr:hypothetical protein [Bacteroidia bacterium]